MKVFKRPGSRFFTYKFQQKGKEYYRSTGTANRREAEDIAAAARRSILCQLAGLHRAGTPTLGFDPGPTLRLLPRRDAPPDERLRTSLFKADRWAPLRLACDQTRPEAAGTQANLGD